MPVRPILLLLAGLYANLRAQAPSARPATPDDSIYALRVDPARYQGLDDVFLLEDVVLRLEADGRSSFTLHRVVQILTTDGVDSWGELSFWHTPDRQRVVLNRIRVVDKDGKVLSDGPAHQQETSPEVEAGAPVYSDRRAIQVTLGGVAVGTLVDYSYSLESLRPWIRGDFLQSWNINGTEPVRRARFVLDAPTGLDVPVIVRNLSVPARDTVTTGRRIRTWVAADVPEVAWQLYSGTPNGVIASIRVGGTISWRDVGAWYDSLSRDRYQLTPEILAAHARQVKGARTLDDSLRATYRWVAQDFRYVSLSLGDGGYRPRAPRDVFETRFGDCKDKTTLFVSLARRMGAVAYPVLVSSDGGVDSLFPSLRQFDHMIAAVRRARTVRYFDVTSPLTPYDELPPALQAEVGLALTGDGPRVVVLPATLPAGNRHDELVVGSLERDGRLVGRYTVSAYGTEQYDLRERLNDMRDQDASARDESLRDYAQSVYSTAVVDSSRYTDGRDLTTPPSVTVWFKAAKVIGRVGDGYYFNLPIPPFYEADVLEQLDAEGARRFPIDIAKVNSPSVYRSAIEFQLPEGWKADLPKDVFVEGHFGYYRAQYSQVGRLLRASREMGGLRGLLPPDSVAALRAWLRAVSQDRSKMIALSRGTGMDLLADTALATEGGVGALPEVVIGVNDLSTDAKVTREGDAAGTGGWAVALASIKPLESYQRDFAAKQIVFAVGHSRFAAVQVTAAAFHTRSEATRPLELLDLFDLSSFLGLYIAQVAGNQASLGATRVIPLDSIGDRARGWVLEMSMPIGTIDLALMFVARGRVCTTVVVAGSSGMQDGDLASLLRTMDQRVRAHEGYLTEVPDTEDHQDVRQADSALAANTDVALNTITYRLPDSAGVTTTDAKFLRMDGSPTYTLSVQGKGLTFPVAGVPAVTAEMQVTLHGTEAQALKDVIATERFDRKQFIRSFLRGMSEVESMFGGLDSLKGDSTTVERVTAPSLGARSAAAVVKMRGVFRMDIDAFVFARGRLSAVVAITRLPNHSQPAAALAVAREMYQRMQRVAPLPRETSPRPALVAAIRRVVDAEHLVDSLASARDFESAFRTVERANLAQAPVGFHAATWNTLCWWASLYGQAKRALPACDAAVAPDTTNMGFRDSRGLARALAGDIAGARDDFAYIVAHADAGRFRDKRAAWLEMLHAGNNPFTAELLEELKGNRSAKN